MAITEVPWWKEGAVYQIYPASYKDSNGDGIGDLEGIIQSLDYIKSIGVDIIWICPMYDSPQVDMGYDISDYKAVYAPYGTVQDMERLLDAAHQRGLRVILDLVVNHTSDQHAWFQESRSSKTNPKRDWYIWKPAKYNAQGERVPPNNWRSNFGGSVWQWDEHTEEYYLHLFCPEQPDLNWDNLETRSAIYEDAMIFWLDKGVDGFRIDTVNMYSKPVGLPDAEITDPTTFTQGAGLVYCNGPKMNEILSEMNAILSRYNAMSVGECPCTPDIDIVLGYVGASMRRLNMVFQFDVVDVGQGRVFKYGTRPFNYRLSDLKEAISRTQHFLDGTDAWTTSFVENHDQARSISRFGDDTIYRERSGKMLAVLFASLSGTLFIYQGQEIGMINVPKDWPIEEYKDVDTINHYNMIKERSNNGPKALAEAHATLQHLARDNARTPMQWTTDGGFTTGTSWMRMNPSTKYINVAEQDCRQDSVLSFWRHLLSLRKQYKKLFIHGRYEMIDATNQEVMSFWKVGQRRMLVVCNFSDHVNPVPVDIEDLSLLLSNVEKIEPNLQAWEGRIYLERGSAVQMLQTTILANS